MIIGAAVVCFPSHVCVAIETRVGNQQWVLTWKWTSYISSDSFYSAAVIFVLIWPGFVIINTYVNEDCGVADMMTESNWKVEGNFCSMLSFFRPKWLIPLLLYAYTHAKSLCLWSISLVALTILQSDCPLQIGCPFVGFSFFLYWMSHWLCSSCSNCRLTCNSQLHEGE